MRINISSVSKAFNGNQILKDLNLSIESGEFITLLGPSGCGKTTTLRCVAGLESPDHGSIAVDGHEFVNAETRTMVPPHKRKVGMVFQSYALWPHMSVAANVAYPLKRRKTPAAELRERVATSLEAVGMGSHAKRYPHELSGGQQQRVALARGLVSAKGVMLFDEPLSNLDAKLRIAMRSEIRRLHDEFGNTSLYVTHDQDEALALSDRVIIMRDGVIEQVGTPSEVQRRPVSRFAADFVGFENILECRGITQESGAPEATFEGGLRTTSSELASRTVPGSFAAFRSSDVVLGETAQPGLAGAGRIRDASFSAEARTVIVDLPGNRSITVAVPDAAINADSYRLGGTSVQLWVPSESLVILDR
ncbi:ABC transporter ATP-binding protein [Arthrobacter koreensis]|uniref:ABC transporter ATP-binding protein n=1 Tax=Arthrobacter koreensis TaxID=199136 RepID=A0ABY6FSP9_9MICC|nr:ABC transporter ATP-binding protein [Arthrobacter koreensis]MEB7446791.1 ABC transporter ATP-binding protein [Arthrobacter koreensis]UYB35852.1 ABC transporter ATP-binding protein [Arthrobacter koreensis]